jgi:hypothetical protein
MVKNLFFEIGRHGVQKYVIFFLFYLFTERQFLQFTIFFLHKIYTVLIFFAALEQILC